MDKIKEEYKTKSQTEIKQFDLCKKGKKFTEGEKKQQAGMYIENN